MSYILSRAIALFIPLILIAASARAWAQPARPTPEWLDRNREAPSGTRYATFRSRTLAADVSYLVYLPPGYDDQTRRYAVIYWLHGLGGTQRTGAEFFVPYLDAAIREGNLPPVIAILVNGMVSSFYCDTADKQPVETVIVEELIPHVDLTYRSVARRQGRIVQGYSMGGFGAAHLGFKYPDQFGAVVVDAGALITAEALRSRHPDLFAIRFGGDAQAFQAEHPFTLIRKNADRVRGSTFVHIGVGSLDALLPRNEELHNLLDEIKITHSYQIVPDVAHFNRAYYKALGAKAFEFHKRALAEVELVDEPPAADALRKELADVRSQIEDAFERAPIRHWGLADLLQPLNEAAQQLQRPGNAAAVIRKVNDAHQRIAEALGLRPLATLNKDEQGRIAAQPDQLVVTVHQGVPDAIVLRFEPSASAAEMTIAVAIANADKVEGQKVALPRSFQSYAVLPITITAEPGKYPAELRLTAGGQTMALPLTVQVRQAGTLNARIMRDSDSAEVAAKVFVEDDGGRLYIVPGESGYRTQSWYAFFKPRFSYINGSFQMPLPPGRYRVTMTKGPAYVPLEQIIEVAAGQVVRPTLKMQRVVETEERGWFSADMHVHGSVTLPMMRAEDVNLATNTIYSSNRPMRLSVHEESSDSLHILATNQEIEHWVFGNGFWFNMPTTVQDPPVGDPIKTPMFYYDQQAHQMGGISMRYMRSRPYTSGERGRGQDQIELAADAALSHLDVWSVMDNSIQQLADGPRSQWGPDVWDSTNFGQHTYTTWYRLLNCGLRLTASAGTSYGRLSKLGFNRVYAYCPDGLNVGSFAAALKRGDGFVTNGPLLWLKVSGNLPGDGVALAGPTDVTVAIDLASAAPVKTLQLISGGKVVASKTIDQWPAGGRLTWEQTIRVDRPTWFAARCFGQDTPRYPHTLPYNLFAHTNPLVVTVAGAQPSSPEDAAYFLKEIDFLLTVTGQIQDEALRKQSQEEFRKAREFYAKMAGE